MKTLDHPDPYRYSLKRLDLHPQHWNLVIQPTILCLLGLTSPVLQAISYRHPVLGSVELSEFIIGVGAADPNFSIPDPGSKRFGSRISDP
jgi:hypothetical protein